MQLQGNGLAAAFNYIIIIKIEIPKIKAVMSHQIHLIMVKAAFSSFEPLDYETLKAKTHDDLIAYIDNLKLRLTRKKKDIKILKLVLWKF
jgi:hypothetical protein